MLKPSDKVTGAQKDLIPVGYDYLKQVTKIKKLVTFTEPWPSLKDINYDPNWASKAQDFDINDWMEADIFGEGNSQHQVIGDESAMRPLQKNQVMDETPHK